MQQDKDPGKVPEITKSLNIKKETESERMISTRNNGHDFSRRWTNLIMLIEDNMDHAELIIRTTKEHPIPNEVRHFPDGRSALDYLFRRDSFSDPVSSPRPQVILLDVHLPGIDGIDLLRTIKMSDELKVIPVIMLTSSAAESDIARAYRNHANSYLVKPVGCEQFKELMDNLCFFWLGHNVNPKI
jgi:CheY-like chemotaxis protein